MEYRFIYNIHGKNSNLKKSRIQETVYHQASSSSYSPVIHDLKCAPFDKIYDYYKKRMFIPEYANSAREYYHMRQSASGHVPVTECLYFLFHWRATLSYLYAVSRALSWGAVYRQDLSAMQLRCNQHDISKAMLSEKDGRFLYWDIRLQSIPPSAWMWGLVYRGPSFCMAIDRLQRFRAHFLFHGQLEIQSLVERDKFLTFFRQYIQPQSIILHYAEKQHFNVQAAVIYLEEYGWTPSRNYLVHHAVQPHWWYAAHEAVFGPLLRVPDVKKISWRRIAQGDLHELAILVDLIWNDWKIVSPEIVYESRVRNQFLSLEQLASFVVNHQRMPYRFFYRENPETQEKEVVIKQNTKFYDLPVSLRPIRDPLLIDPT